MRHYPDPPPYVGGHAPSRRPFAGFGAALITTLLLSAGPSPAAIPPVEKLLPADTLFVIAAPDFAQVRAIYGRSPFGRFWNDPEMKPFRDKFAAKWKDEFVSPLERDLGVRFDAYGSLPQGLVAFAVTQDGWNARDDQEPGYLFLLDARDKSELLKKQLAELRQHWMDAGKPIRTEKIRDVEFSVVPLASNDVPKTLHRFLPQKQEVQELGKEPPPKKDRGEIVIGQFESLLIIGSSTKAVEKVATRLTGGAGPALADDPAFEANRLALFRDAPAFAWLNAKAFFAVLAGIPPEKPNPQAPNPLPTFEAAKLVAGTGLGALKTATLVFRESAEGATLELSLAVPDVARQGLFKMLASENRDSNPPAFVPADTVKFQRWRIDAQKAIPALEKMLADVSPQMLNSWNFMISSAEEGVKQDEPTYDFRKNLFANVGDDIIVCEKPPRGRSPAELAGPPTLLLVGTPNAEALAKAMRGLLVLRTAEALTPKIREFLGRTIYSVGLPSFAAPGAPAPPRTLHYAAVAGYVAFSMDVSLLEEFLRGSDNPPKALRETPGLMDAAQKVGGQNTGWFGYENQVEAMRVAFETLRKPAGAPAASTPGLDVLANYNPMARPEKSFKDWMDFSLLPEFEKVAKYFHFTVSSGSANADGITFKYFWPTPPALRK